MSTVQDFENAPVGSTATAPNGNIALKTSRRELAWTTYDSYGGYYGCRRSADLGGFTLNPTAPTNSREALDLAWELGHEVKEGQPIPKGTPILRRVVGRVREYQAGWDFDETAPFDPLFVRTFDPLPDPKPYWADAPAVMACVKGRIGDPQVFSRGNETGTQWVRNTKVYHWYELVGVTPLYPKEG